MRSHYWKLYMEYHLLNHFANLTLPVHQLQVARWRRLHPVHQLAQSPLKFVKATVAKVTLQSCQASSGGLLK